MYREGVWQVEPLLLSYVLYGYFSPRMRKFITFGGGGKTAGEEDLSTTVEDVKEGGMCLCFKI